MPFILRPVRFALLAALVGGAIGYGAHAAFAGEPAPPKCHTYTDSPSECESYCAANYQNGGEHVWLGCSTGGCCTCAE